MNSKKKALFLDRDGVINVDYGYVCSKERTCFIEGIFDVCRRARGMGYALVVVTNQAGIARGYYSELEFHQYMIWVKSIFVAQNAKLDAYYYCPHHPDASLAQYRGTCNCRKPAPGMLIRAADELGLDLARSIMLGDKKSDEEASINAGVGKFVLIEKLENLRDNHPAKLGTLNVSRINDALAGFSNF